MDSKRVIYFLPLINLLDSIGGGLFNPVIIDTLTRGNVLAAQTAAFNTDATMITTAFIFVISPAYFFALPILGFASDYFGRRKLLLFCTALSALGYFLNCLSFQSGMLGLLFLGSFFKSTGHAILPIVLAAISDMTRRRNRLLPYSLTFLGLIFLVILGDLSTHLLKSQLGGINTPLLIVIMALIASCLNFALVLWCIPETHRPLKSLAQGILDLPATCLDLIRRKIIYMVVLMLLVLNFASGILFQKLPYFLAVHDKFYMHGSTLFSVYFTWVASVSFLVILPWVYRKFRLYKTLLIGLGLTCAGFPVLMFSFHGVARWLVTIPVITGSMMLVPLIWMCLARRIASQARGLGLGLSNMAWGLTWILGGNLAVISADQQPSTVLLIAELALIFIFILLGKPWLKAQFQTKQMK